MNEPVLETRGLRKEFGPKAAVRDLTLSVSRGEVFGFLGPNGAGKTTAVKLLLGLVRPTAGGGRLLGRPLGDPSARARIGFLPEHFRFHEWLEGRELLRFHGRLLGLRSRTLEARIDDLLRRLELGDAGHRRLREYSKGMCQRIGLAQALLGEPELVFLDEPTSGLDPFGRLLVRDLIRDLRSRGTTVFLNSHLLGEVEVTCDRVAFVANGRVVRDMALSTPDRGLEVEIRVDRSTPALLDGLGRFGDDVREEGGVVRLRVESEDRLPEISRWLVSKGAGRYRLAAQRRSLEAVFLEVIGEGQRGGDLRNG